MSALRFYRLGDFGDDVEWRIISVRSKSDHALRPGDVVSVNKSNGGTTRVELVRLDLDASCDATTVELWHFDHLPSAWQ